MFVLFVHQVLKYYIYNTTDNESSKTLGTALLSERALLFWEVLYQHHRISPNVYGAVSLHVLNDVRQLSALRAIVVYVNMLQ